MNQDELRRRSLITSLTTTGAVLLAGCGAVDDAGEDFTYIDEEPDYDRHFDDVEEFEGTVDALDEDTVEVRVGAGDSGNLYSPMAVAISPGTTVVWEWTGEGGTHSVTEETDMFDSGLVGEEGHTFEQTFDDEGVYLYECNHHALIGMKGAVYVTS